MNFANPNIFLHMFWILPVCVLLMWFGHRRRRRRLAVFIGESELAKSLTSNQSVARRRLRDALMLVTVFFVLVAAAGPYWGSELVPRPVHSRDLLVVLDTSRSMLAKDIAPSRLQHAKQFVRQLAIGTAGSRYGLIAFAGSAFLECPLTQNIDGFLSFLDDVGTDSIPVGGTNIELALSEALDAFEAAEGDHRAIIMITDGDELQGNSGQALEAFREKKIPIFVVGIGNPDLGSFIQLADNSFVTDEKGNRVRTKLNQEGLRRLSAATGGIYVHSTVIYDGLEAVLRRVRGLVPEKNEDATMSRPIQRYQIPLLLGLVCLLVRMSVGERRNARRPAPALIRARSTATVLLLLAAIATTAQTNPAPPALPPLPPAAAAAAAPLPAGEPVSEYQQQLEQVIDDLLADLDAAKTDRERAYYNYNIGVNYQQLERAGLAESHYNKALDFTDDPELRALASQNLGVLKHDQSTEAMMRDPDEALEQLQEAEDFYRESMRAQPTAKGIGENQELALLQRQLIEQIKEMQEALKKLQEDAQEKAEEAMEQQQEANEAAQSGDPQQQQKQQQAQEKTQEAQEAVQELADAARGMGQEQAADMLDEIAEQLDKAQEEQERAGDEDTGDEERLQAGNKAEEMLEDAVRKLGVEDPSDEEPKDGEQETAQGAEQSEDDDEGDEEGDSVADVEDPQKGAESESEQPPSGDEQDVDKSQALRILEQMLEQEQDLKQHLKEVEKQQSRHAPVARDW
ncbi:MAG: VWA domain-containing protein [Lentisphaeria bacterium]|jgi:Ca-activated chloride channel family protein|nr:VWA domain-containing protein [Lentisphaeria bacterium]MDP7739905.1 VWA domain-containing protein [Lentisphaeria bacterium]